MLYDHRGLSVGESVLRRGILFSRPMGIGERLERREEREDVVDKDDRGRSSSSSECGSKPDRSFSITWQAWLSTRWTVARRSHSSLVIVSDTCSASHFSSGVGATGPSNISIFTTWAFLSAGSLVWANIRIIFPLFSGSGWSFFVSSSTISSRFRVSSSSGSTPSCVATMDNNRPTVRLKNYAISLVKY